MATPNTTAQYDSFTINARICQARAILASLLENGADDGRFSLTHEQTLGCLHAADTLLAQAQE
jgi:hypothetical protein